MQKRKAILPILLIMFFLLMVMNNTNAEETAEEAYMQLRILQTTDLHAHMLDYDYKKRKPTVAFGLARTAALIKAARNEAKNSLLFDGGDALVGNALGGYALKRHSLDLLDIHPVYKAMNTLQYDAATIGNHEFDHGLEYLQDSLRGARFPYVNANIYLDGHDIAGHELNYFKPYTIINKEFIDDAGLKQTLKVGVIGFLTPIVAEWNKQYFAGKLKVKNIQKTAEHFVPIMKNQGADIIIALAHVGMNADNGLKAKTGNAVYSLSKVDGIDVILYGHTHSLFPVKGSAKQVEGIDQNNGKINGKAAVQAGYWGNHLGIIDLSLVKKGGEWTVTSSQSSAKPIYRIINKKKRPIVKPDPIIQEIMKMDHYKTLQYLKNSK